MYLFSTAKSVKALTLAFVFACFSISFISGQATFRISKPIVGATQVCSNTTNYSNYLSYAFSSNVVNSSGYSIQHNVELSNENGLITPRNVSYTYPSPNQINTGSFDMNSLNLPSGSGYRIRIYSNSPLIYGDYSETFTVLASPVKPTLNVSGSINLCTGTSQALTVTNPENTVSYQWQNYSSNITNAITTTYNATINGSYSVKAISSNGCAVASNSVYVSQNSALSSSLSVNLPNGYYSGNLLFTLPSQAFTLRANFSGGKSPYGFTLNDGITNTTETNISYTKDYNLTSPANGTRTYTLVSVTDACGTQLTNTASAKVRINESNYCSSSGQGLLAINNFSIQGTTINNLNSGKSADGWGEFLTPANINANVNYNFTLGSNNSTQKYFAIWADLNQNNTFESTEKIFPTGSNNYYGQSMTNSYTGILKLPTTTYNGQIRMRVQLSDDSYSANYNCNSLSNGETEDYVLRVFNGISPTTITTDSLPRLGLCKNGTFSLGFTVSGASLPANTTYRVEASDYANFSNSYVIGTGQTSPIACNTSSLYSPYNYYVRVVPTTNIARIIYIKAPNQLNIKNTPTAYLTPFFFNNNWPNTNWGCCYGTGPSASLSVAENSGPFAVYVGVSSSNSNFPISVTMSDGRAFTVGSASIGGAVIRIDSNIVANGIKKYKIAQVSNSLCINNNPDSVYIRGGNPYLKIMKVFKGNNSNDTTSISKLCGYFQVKFAGDFLDTLSYKFYHVQISDANGSFANPQDIGHVCIYKVLNELQGGQNIGCSIPSTLPPGSGYRLRIVKKTGNLLSPVYSTVFEVLDPNTASFTANLLRSVINEGEATALNVNFTSGTPPYSVYVSNPNTSQNYTTIGNNTALSINVGPTNGLRYELYSYSGSACGNNNRLYKYLDVRTLDKDNSQWYVKPITYQNSYYEYLRNMSITNSSDTLFKKTFTTYYNSGLTNGYHDYNSTNLLTSKTTVQVGESYTLSQADNSNSTGYGNNLTGIWIDANQDGDFDDVGEELAKNQFGSHWNLTQTQSFVIPTNATIGFTRIRVRTASKGYNAEPFDLYASNPLDKNGVTYDIPIVVLSNSVNSIISTPKISGNTLCNGNSFTVDFSKYGIPAGTSANVELSDASGNFPASPTVIGQGTTSSINVTLPLLIPSGSYNIRVVSNGVTSPLSTSFNITTNQLTSMVDGDWHAGSTWSCGRVPTYVDATTVAGGTTVTVFSGDAQVGSILTNGVLSFLNGTTLIFNQP
jgi:GEVED domain